MTGKNRVKQAETRFLTALAAASPLRLPSEEQSALQYALFVRFLPPELVSPATRMVYAGNPIPDKAEAARWNVFLSQWRYSCDNFERPELAPPVLTPSLLTTLLEYGTPDRRATGTFYTPPPLASFMAEYALITRTEARDRGSFAPTVLDPACGGGTLLLAFFDACWRHANLTPESPPPDRRAVDTFRHFYGWDTNILAVQTTRMRLYLALLAAAPEIAPLLPPDSLACIRVGDALLTDDNGQRFDRILMNPPYRATSRIPGNERPQESLYRDQIRERYGTADDLYLAFFAFALERLQHNGVLCALTPDTFLNQQRKRAVRDRLLAAGSCWFLAFSKGTFAASVYPAMTLLRTGSDATGLDRASSIKSAASCHRFTNLRDADFSLLTQPPELEQRTVLYPPDAEGASPRFPQNFAVVRASLSRDVVILGDIAPARDIGIHSGNVRHRLFFAEPPPNRTVHKLVQGSQILRYGIWWDAPRARYRYVDIQYRADPTRRGIGRGGKASAHGEYWHFCGDIKWHHVPERILLRQTSDTLFAGYLCQSEAPVYTDNTLLTMVPNPEAVVREVTALYLLALLNSAFVQ